MGLKLYTHHALNTTPKRVYQVGVEKALIDRENVDASRKQSDA